MNEFIARYEKSLRGVLSGFDRLVFRGQLPLIHDAGMKGYLWAKGIAWKDYAAQVSAISRQVKEASLAGVAAAQRPVLYLTNSEQKKEELARSIARRDRVSSGTVCAFTAVEPCLSWRVVGDRQSHRLQLLRCMRRCLFIYHYWIDPVFGFMSARLQSWFPFTLYVYINGREWLARQMDEAGLRYRRHDNCFSSIEDFARAQALMDEQLNTNWEDALNGCAVRVHPLFAELCSNYAMQYYWTSFQSEWAMDLVFAGRQRLRRLYPQLIHLGMVSLSSPDVMRFMDKKVTRQGDAMGSCHEIVTDYKLRSEGVRIKHRLGKNSIKMYDKAYARGGSVLRTEFTLNAPEQFRVYRHKSGDDDGPMQWRPLRAGVADLHRRAEVSQKALDRYCDALAAVDDSATVEQLTAAVEQPVRWHGRRVRALHPFASDDLALLRAVNDGRFAENGLRNRDLQQLLYCSPPESAQEQRRRSAAVSRKLRLLRAHGIIHKLSHTHRYQVTSEGRRILNAILTAQAVTTEKLLTLMTPKPKAA